MSKRVSVVDKLNQAKKDSPRDEMFRSTDPSRNKASEEDSKKNMQSLTKKTHYLTEELIEALIMYKAFEDKDISETVREALYAYIPEVYIQKARDKRK